MLVARASNRAHRREYRAGYEPGHREQQKRYLIIGILLLTGMTPRRKPEALAKEARVDAAEALDTHAPAHEM